MTPIQRRAFKATHTSCSSYNQQSSTIFCEIYGHGRFVGEVDICKDILLTKQVLS